MGRKRGNTGCFVLAAIAGALAVAAVVTDEILKAGSDETAVLHTLLFGGGERLLLAFAAGCLIVALGRSSLLFPRVGRGRLTVAAGFAVALANFPFFCLADGLLTVTADGGTMTVYVLYCLAVGLFEELVFRGLAFPLVLEKLAKKRYGIFLATVLTNAAFSLLHLLNLLQGAGVGATFLQVGYSFLVGCMCNVVLIATRSLWAPVLIHAAFDVGGTMTSLRVADGSHWNAPSIAVMVVVGTLAAVYLAYTFFRRGRESLALLADEPPDKPDDQPTTT